MSDTTAIMDAALAYAKRGWSLVPVFPRSKKPSYGEGWQHHTLTDSGAVEQHWTAFPDYNVGVQLGEISGVIDVEADSDAAESLLAELLGEDCPVVPTYQSTRGKHRLFKWTPSAPSDRAVFKFRDLIEFRVGGNGKAAQSVLPPSVHPSGAVYKWLVPPDEVNPQPLPARALELIRKELGTPRNGHAAPDGEPILDGHRGSRLTSMAGSMRRAGFGEEEMAAALLLANARRCLPPVEEGRVRAIARSMVRYRPDEPLLATIIFGGKIPPAAGQQVSGFCTSEHDLLTCCPAAVLQKPAEPFPIDVLPRLLQRFALSVAKSLPCPVDFPGAMVLAVLSALFPSAANCILHQNGAMNFSTAKRWTVFPESS
jgi:hypothetical protein